MKLQLVHQGANANTLTHILLANILFECIQLCTLFDTYLYGC